MSAPAFDAEKLARLQALSRVGKASIELVHSTLRLELFLQLLLAQYSCRRAQNHPRDAGGDHMSYWMLADAL